MWKANNFSSSKRSFKRMNLNKMAARFIEKIPQEYFLEADFHFFAIILRDGEVYLQDADNKIKINLDDENECGRQLIALLAKKILNEKL